MNESQVAWKTGTRDLDAAVRVVVGRAFPTVRIVAGRWAVLPLRGCFLRVDEQLGAPGPVPARFVLEVEDAAGDHPVVVVPVAPEVVGADREPAVANPARVLGDPRPRPPALACVIARPATSASVGDEPGHRQG